jgi:ribose-phosphate pyrophosphokinase
MNSNLKIFSDEHSASFSEQVCGYLVTSRGMIYPHTFASGECYVQLKENVRGSDVFIIIQPEVGNVNESLMRAFVMADASRRASAKRITAVFPMFFYQRQDRKDKSRTPISAKLVMDLISASGFNRVLTMDLHAAQICGFTNLPIDHLSSKPSLVTALGEHNVNIDVVVSPDIGAVKRNQEYAEILKKDLAIVVKRRKSDTDVEVTNFIGDVDGKNVLVVDDLTESVGTLTEASKACKDRGAKEINIAITHPCLSKKGFNALQEGINSGLFTKFFYTNTIDPLKFNYKNNIFSNNRVIKVNVASVFATAIERIHNNESVSELFVV